MGRVIQCDACADAIALDIGEGGWFRLTNESMEMEAWFCSVECAAAWIVAYKDKGDVRGVKGFDDEG